MPRQRRVIDVDVYEDDDRKTTKSKKSNSKNNSSNKADNSNLNFNNIDFNQVAGLLKDVDLNKLSSMLGGFGGLLGSNQGVLDNLAGMMGGSGAPQGSSPNATKQPISQPVIGDKKMEILNAIRPMVSPERAALIDIVVQLYVISKILKR